MNYLIDTQIFIWGMENSTRLSTQVKEILKDPTNQVYLSVASIWEIVIKVAKNKLKVPKDIEASIQNSEFKILDIDLNHVLGISKLPSIHEDPFDRIIISQTQVEGLTLITSDSKIWRYKVKLLKC